VRIKTSITLPEDLLQTIDRTGPNRSAFIERASRAYLARLGKLKREQRDIQLINAHPRRLNAGAMDVIGYQFSRSRR
jgi:metal-responsive CopG/Arc/MetJ family transcriptional regulator